MHNKMLEEFTLEFISIGMLGGCARALYGLYKSLGSRSSINKGYFISTIILSGIIGGLLGSIFTIDYRVAGFAGYVGTDILENILTGILPKTITLNKE